MFHPRRQPLTGIQDIARQLFICLESVDVGATLNLYNLAAELDVDIKKAFLVSNVMEAVGMLSRISINKVIWKGKNTMLQILVQLHKLAVEENILQQIQDILKGKGGELLEEALVGGGMREDDKVKVTTGVIIQRLLMIFLVVPTMNTMSTNTMVRVISGMGNVMCPQSRLPDLANVLVGIGLLQKVEERLPQSKKTPAFQYVGPVVEEVDVI